jgi:preprotein translocase subunit YajC
MPNLHTTLEPGDVVLIPAGTGASISFIAKSGKRSRVSIDCNAPVTITRASEAAAQRTPQEPPTRIARRPSTE